MEIVVQTATLLLATVSLALSLTVLLFKAVRVHDMSLQTHGTPQPTVHGLDVNIVHVHGRTSRVDADCPRNEIERTARLYTTWINALIKRNLGTAARDLVADIYKTADRDWDLAHIHNADDRGPDMTLFIPVEMSLVKVGAEEFRFIVPPVAADLPGRNGRADAGHETSESGKPGEDEMKNI